jgi:hypothetical protein
MLVADGIQLGSLRIFAMFQEPFRHFSAFWAIEIATEFLFVGTVASPMRVLFKPFDDGCEPNPHDASRVARQSRRRAHA